MCVALSLDFAQTLQVQEEQSLKSLGRSLAQRLSPWLSERRRQVPKSDHSVTMIDAAGQVLMARFGFLASRQRNTTYPDLASPSDPYGIAMEATGYYW